MLVVNITTPFTTVLYQNKESSEINARYGADLIADAKKYDLIILAKSSAGALNEPSSDLESVMAFDGAPEDNFLAYVDYVISNPIHAFDAYQNFVLPSIYHDFFLGLIDIDHFPRGFIYARNQVYDNSSEGCTFKNITPFYDDELFLNRYDFLSLYEGKNPPNYEEKFNPFLAPSRHHDGHSLLGVHQKRSVVQGSQTAYISDEEMSELLFSNTQTLNLKGVGFSRNPFRGNKISNPILEKQIKGFKHHATFSR